MRQVFNEVLPLFIVPFILPEIDGLCCGVSGSLAFVAYSHTKQLLAFLILTGSMVAAAYFQGQNTMHPGQPVQVKNQAKPCEK